MNRTLLAVVAAALALLLPTQAMAACRTIKPKTWKGTAQLATHAQVTRQDFVLNGCKFHDGNLNGFDGVVFDVASHKGLKATAKWTTTSPVRPDRVSGVFLTSSCGIIIGKGFVQPTAGKSSSMTIPSNAKWLLVSPETVAPSRDIAITVSSPGRKCP